VDVADLSEIIPGLELTAHSISWSGIQVIQTDSQPVTVVGLDLGEAAEALELLQAIRSVTSGSVEGNLLRLSTDPQLNALQTGDRTYLLQGDREACSEVAQLLLTEGTPPSAGSSAGLAGLLPGGGGTVEGTDGTSSADPTTAAGRETSGEPAKPEPKEKPQGPVPAPPVVPGLPEGSAVTPDTPAEAPEASADDSPEPLKLEKDGYLRKAYLCTVVQGEKPVELEGPLPTGAERLGVYLEIRDAPRGSMLEMELIREGFSHGRRMMSVNGDRRTVAYFAPDGGFAPGQYWLEIRADDRLVSRMLFEVE
jgi:hypothetical protein